MNQAKDHSKAASGMGAAEKVLSPEQIQDIVTQAAGSLPDGKKYLCIIPDDTRTCPAGSVLRMLSRALGEKAKRLDALVALGTHPPMSQEAIYRYLQIDKQIHQKELPRTEFYNHAWDDPRQLKSIGTVSASEMERLSQGRIKEEFPVSVNKLLFDYDHIIIIGPTFPHEVVGFSGGNKYFFPGVAGPEILHAFHWLGALITNRSVIGSHYTPVRAVIDYCASLIQLPKSCISLVVSSKGTHGVYFGTPEEAYERAADLSAEVNIRWMPRQYDTVLSVCPPMYPELWTAGKCMYKLEPVIKPGGKLIIYGPHIDEISVTHGGLIEQIGYHCLAYFQEQMEKFQDIPKGILAHSTHVRGGGTYKDGVEKCNVEVILATSIPEEKCRSIHLGYMDPTSIQFSDYENREHEGVLFVPKAGELLYKLESERA